MLIFFHLVLVLISTALVQLLVLGIFTYWLWTLDYIIYIYISSTVELSHYLNIVHVRHVVISLFSLAHFSMGVVLCYFAVCGSLYVYL